jgi:3-hydroxyacyl-CoA dehydrogenase
MGKEPVEANDSPGSSRTEFLCPMINEAVFALQENVGTPEAIDRGDEARHESPDGSAHPGRFDRLWMWCCS